MSAHTPGPWEQGHRHDGDSRSVWYHRAGPNGGTWFRLANCKGDEAEANAALISAAPDLLEACEALAAYFGATWAGAPEERAKLRAAIAKARGGK